MKFTVVAVGKLKEKYWVQACEEYLKRLQPYAKTKVIEVPDRDPARLGGVEAAKRAEAESILSAIPSRSYVFLLAIEGKPYSSVSFSKRLDSLMVSGANEFTFVIGGSDGVSSTVFEQANETLSFGALTLPHNLARVVLLEQLYRTQKISRGEPYHK